MLNKRVLFLVAVAAMAFAVFAFVGTPYAQIDFAEALQYTSSGGGGDSRGNPIDYGSTTQGEAAEVVATTYPNSCVKAVFTAATDLYDAPNGNVAIPAASNGGGEHFASGEDASGEWVFVVISTESVWVQKSTVNLVSVC